MTDVQWQMLLGATVVSKAAWEKIPADIRPALIEATREAGQKLRDEVRRTGPRDVEAMKKRGLNVVAVDAKGLELWRKTAEGVYPKIRGGIVPADAFDEAMRYRDEYRKQASGAKAGSKSTRLWQKTEEWALVAGPRSLRRCCRSSTRSDVRSGASTYPGLLRGCSSSRSGSPSSAACWRRARAST